MTYVWSQQTQTRQWTNQNSSQKRASAPSAGKYATSATRGKMVECFGMVALIVYRFVHIFLLSKCNSQLKIATFAWIRRIFLKIVRMFRDKQENWIAFVHVSSVPGGSLAKPCYGRHALHSQTRAFRSCCVLWREATWPVAVWLPSPGRPVWNSNLVDHRSCTSFWKAGRRIRECTKGLLQETGTSLCKNTALVFSLHL